MLELSHSSVEAPDGLVRRLELLKLCRPADFRRARATVRRLSRDLPTFDSVWIDAFVQRRILTPYQARILESDSADQLLIGSRQVIDQLGHGPHGMTLLVRTAGRRDHAVLKRLTVTAEAIDDCRQRLAAFLNQTRGWAHPHLVTPHELLDDVGPELIAVSRWVPGLTLTELLVRRGRFPAAIVLEIGRQLASGLAALQEQGLVHGDIRLSNVRLTDRGLAVLVDGGIRPAVCPELTIHATLALEAYDGVAPELIGTGLGANATSEIYSLGCLLWQLLTGRPPFSVADPLMKLAAHQTQRISDVRTLAPDSPAPLAELVAAMTSPDVNERPRSFDELLHRWGRPGWSSRSRLKRYRRHFDGMVPHFAQQSERPGEGRWSWIAVSLLVAAGGALTMADQGLRNELVSITHRLSAAFQSRPTSTATASGSDLDPAPTAARSATELLPLPPPSPTGEILLTEAGPYDVAKVTAANHLAIRGARGVSPVIRIGRESLWLAAESITLENLTVTCQAASGPTLATVLIKSQQLSIQNCVFQRMTPEERSASAPSDSTGDEPRRTAAQNVTHLAWRPLDALASAPPRKIEISETVFRGDGTAIWMAELPQQVSLSNCLKLEDGGLLAASPKAAPQACTVHLNQLTLRDCGPLLRLAGTYAEQAQTPTVEFVANDCVFDLADASPGLIELHSQQLRSDPRTAVRMSGRGSVMAPDVRLLVHVDPSGPSPGQGVDADESFEGIVVSDLTFAGPATGPIGNSRLESLTAPRAAGDAQPGVDTSRLPAASSTPLAGQFAPAEENLPKLN